MKKEVVVAAVNLCNSEGNRNDAQYSGQWFNTFDRPGEKEKWPTVPLYLDELLG